MIYVSTVIVGIVIVSHLHHSPSEGEDQYWTICCLFYAQLRISAKPVLCVDAKSLLISLLMIQHVPGLCTKPSTVSIEHFASQPEHPSAGMTIPPSNLGSIPILGIQIFCS